VGSGFFQRGRGGCNDIRTELCGCNPYQYKPEVGTGRYTLDRASRNLSNGDTWLASRTFTSGAGSLQFLFTSVEQVSRWYIQTILLATVRCIQLYTQVLSDFACGTSFSWCLSLYIKVNARIFFSQKRQPTSTWCRKLKLWRLIEGQLKP
jgi:hypothetical protein